MTKALLHPRQQARRLALQGLYAWQFSDISLHQLEKDLLAGDFNDFTEQEEAVAPKKVDVEYFIELLHKIPTQIQALDEVIAPFLSRPLSRLTPIEHAILRLSTYELKHKIDIPAKVVINEGVELSKLFGAQDAHKFINGVLDKISKSLRSASELGKGI